MRLYFVLLLYNSYHIFSVEATYCEIYGADKICGNLCLQTWRNANASCICGNETIYMAFEDETCCTSEACYNTTTFPYGMIFLNHQITNNLIFKGLLSPRTRCMSQWKTTKR